MRNNNSTRSQQTTLRYRLSRNQAIGRSGGTQVATDSVGRLNQNQTSQESAMVTINGTGTWYIGACVDSYTLESPDTNNCFSFGNGVRVTVTAAAVAPQITTQPTDQSVTATGTPTPTYQWRFEGSDIAGATSASYAISSAALTNAGDYTVVVTNTAGTVTSSAATLTVTAAATPDARVSIANASVAENAAAGSIGFTVSLDRAVDNAVTLAVAYTAGTATLADDLDTRPTTVTINRGQTEATLAVPVTNDALVERNETFTVTLSEGTTSLPDGVTIGTDNEATGTITDADTAGVSLSATDPPPASEGGTITFTVELDNPVAEGFSLGWAASNGTATVDDDLDDQSGTVEIAANAETATFTIPVTNDDDTESSETFTVALTGAPTGLVNIAPSRVTVDRTSATGTINASDAPDGNTVTIGNRSVAENVAGGSIGFTVSLTRAVDSDVTLAVAYTAGTASLDDDLGTPLLTTVTIDQGNTSATLAVPIANEVLVEGDETFTVTLSEGTTPLPEGVEIGNGTATGTITNDDEAEIRPTVSEVNEAGGSLIFRPGVTAPLAQDLVLSWSVTGGTASAADFSQYVSSGTVTIPARQNSGSILFFPRDDDLVEGSETLTLTFAPAPGTTLPDGVTFRSTTATATIRDSDEVDINLRVVADVSETDERLTFRPVLSRRLTQDVTLSWEVTGGTASADDFSEYVGSGMVTIEAGRGGAPIRFFPLDDDAVEGDETLEVTISAALGTLPRGVNLGTTTTATATIADDDEPPATPVAPEITTQPVNQSVTVGGSATFTVTATGTPTYQWRRDGTNIDGATSASYTISNVALTNAGEYTVVVTNTAGTVTSSAATLTVTAATGTPTITTEPVDQSVMVGGSATFTVTATGTPTPTYQWRRDGTNIDGATSATYTIANAALSDAGDYSVVVTNPAGSDTSRNATLTVTAAAVAPQITTQPTDQSVTVGETATFTVTATGTPTPTYQWRFEGSDIAGATSASYTLSSAALTNAGDYTVVVSNTAGTVTSSAATLTVTAANDDFLSVLTEPRRTAAMSALRCHVGRFERLTSSAAHNRLNGRGHADSFGISEDAGSGNMAKSVDPGDSQWGVWLNSAYAGFSGESGGRQADLYTGVDYLNANGNLVGGVLLGIESAQLDVGQADYESEYRHYGFYAGLRLTERLIWDGAVSYGTATPQISLGDVYADYDARRFSIRTELTGTYDLLASGALTVSPQLGLSYARERLGDFIDSVDGIGRREVLEFGRISAGPRFIWRLPTAREYELEFGTRLQWDVLRDAEGRQTSLSGAVDLGMRFSLTSKLNLGVFLEADGLGNEDEFSAYGGRLEINFGF